MRYTGLGFISWIFLGIKLWPRGVGILKSTLKRGFCLKVTRFPYKLMNLITKTGIFDWLSSSLFDWECDFWIGIIVETQDSDLIPSKIRFILLSLPNSLFLVFFPLWKFLVINYFNLKSRLFYKNYEILVKPRSFSN